MAPNIIRKRSTPKSDYIKAKEEEKAAKDWIKNNCEDVGEKFTEEVRAMHYGDKEERNVHGIASYEDTKELLKESGITEINN